jgi:hypothetical protein
MPPCREGRRGGGHRTNPLFCGHFGSLHEFIKLRFEVNRKSSVDNSALKNGSQRCEIGQQYRRKIGRLHSESDAGLPVIFRTFRQSAFRNQFS